MPTTKPRHLITETEHVAKALDDAAERWPEDADSRAKLLVHLVEEGHRTLLDEAARRRRLRLDVIHRNSGALSGVYGPDYLADLREDWPE